MSTSSPSPTPSLATSPTSTVTPLPQPSTPSPDPPSETNANPPDSSTISPPPQPVTSPPPASPPPTSPPPATTSPPPAATSPPAVPATSPPHPPTNPATPSVDAPPPSSPPPPPTTTTPTTPLPTSPPPPTTTTPTTLPPSPPPPPSPTTIAPPVSPRSSPPSDPSTPPPPPTTKPKSPPPSSLSPPHSSPPPPASKSPSPVSQLPPPRSIDSPPPSTRPARQPPLSPQSPKSSPSPPAQEPLNSPPSRVTPSSLPTVSPLSPSPPVSNTTLGSLVPSSAKSPSATSTASPPSKGGVPLGGIVAIGVVVGFVMLGLIGLVAFYISKRKRRDFKHNGGYIVPSPYASSPRSDSNLIVKTAVSSSAPFVRSASGSGTLSPHSHGGLGHSRSWFTYQELYEATHGFALEDLLGEGGFGSVYKGVLANGQEIAVKQLKIGGSQGEREFQAEVEIISRIHHKHLVSLVGYCMCESKRLLVYEFVPNQTLYYHLHGENRPVMDWATRVKISVGAARGIAYLHEDCHPRIIHRDIKSSNILLDNKFEARVADFGLAKLALDVETHVSTRVMGTFGYMAPEYATSGKLTDKSDVYSFGVVLLELLTGRKPVDASQPLGDESLVEWARPLLSHALETGQVEGLVDPRLEKNYVESELFLMIEAAAACVRHSATKRPRMAQVVRAFDGLSPSDLSNGMRVGQSEIYDSAQQSAEIRWFRRMAFGSQDYSTDYFSEAVRNNTGSLNRNQNNLAPVFLTQHSRNDPSQQQSQNLYFSSHRTQGPTFSKQLSQDSTVSRQNSQNLSSQNPSFSGQSSRNGYSSSRQSQLPE